MAHYSEQRWLLYTQDGLEESERHEMEEHLAACDECLTLYIQQLEQVPIDMPDSVIGAALVNQVVYRLREPSRHRPVTTPLRLRMLHYSVAAAITLLLMTSGVFDRMLSSEERDPVAPTTESISGQVMERALSLFDLFESKEENLP